MHILHGLYAILDCGDLHIKFTMLILSWVSIYEGQSQMTGLRWKSLWLWMAYSAHKLIKDEIFKGATIVNNRDGHLVRIEFWKVKYIFMHLMDLAKTWILMQFLFFISQRAVKSWIIAKHQEIIDIKELWVHFEKK